MKLKRSYGILLHITSLPGSSGMGTLGEEAYRFVDFLEKSGASYWQILPLGPVSMVHACSPYTSNSTFAGNINLISIDELSKESWFRGKLKQDTLTEKNHVDFEKILPKRLPVLKKAAENFSQGASEPETLAFEKFCLEESYWLDDYALFSVLTEKHNTDDWQKWPEPLAERSPGALEDAAGYHREEIRFQKFLQYTFFNQWKKLKSYCNNKGIEIIGDIPVYVSLEGADAWSHREIFQLDDKTGRPSSVSGVPPDYFSETGQRWGNPLYRWLNRDESLNEITYSWWRRRISHLEKLVDLLRIDHFRGFESFWAIPADEPTAVKGTWESGPGTLLFDRLKDDLGDLPLIAEDLGIITPEVEALRDRYEFPGMKILHFAFDRNNKNSYLPHNIENKNTILYTGTHDNNTTNGWFYEGDIDEETQKYIMEYLGNSDFDDMHMQLTRAAFRSTAAMVIIPAQDIPGYGKNFRMNTPGTIKGNWRFKLTADCLTEKHSKKLKKMADIYRRNPEKESD